MSKAVITKSLLSDIADAIRAKTGKSASMTPAAMADEIEAIQTGGDVPTIFYSNAGFPNDYTYPYSLMRPFMFCSETTRGSFSSYFRDVHMPTLTAIPSYAFCNKVNGDAFAQNDKLKSVDADVALSVGEQAFNNCGIETATLPEVTNIYQRGFAHCKLLTSITVPKVVHLFENAFLWCSALTALVAPALTTIDSMALSRCSALKTLVTGQISTLGSSAFAYCGLERLVLSGTYTSIPYGLVQNCTSLVTLDIDSQVVNSIGNMAFNGCTALKALILRRTDGIIPLQYTGALTNSLIATGAGYIYVPDDLVDTYKAATNWATYASKIKPISEYVEA